MSRGDPEFYYTQAERLVSEGKFAAAELMLRQATELGGNNQVYVAALATLLGLQEGRGEESLELLKEQLEKNPEEPSLLVAQALTAKASGNAEEAEKALRKAVKVNSNHAFAHHSLSKLLVDKGSMGEAEVHACKAFALVPDQPDYAMTAIELLEAAGKHDYAYEVASLGASFCPEEMELVQKAVEGALEREEPQRAWETLEESNDDLPWVLGWKATLLDYQGNPERADALLEQGHDRFPEDPDFLFLEAAIWVRRQQPEQAMMLIERLLELCPTHRGALRLRADIAFGNDSTTEAVADLQAMLELEPGDTAVALELVSALYRARRYREALDVLQERQKQPEPLSAQMLVYLVLCHASLGEIQDSLQLLPDIPKDMILAALTELNTYGCNNAAEQSLRDKLELLVPEEELAAAAAAEEDEDDDEDEPAKDEAEKRRPEAPKPALPGVRVDVPQNQDLRTLIAESKAYEEEDEEVWVEIDEETGEEYVWVEVDEDEDE